MAMQFVPGIVMTAVGSQYDLSDCPNGAARWLFGAGITYLVSSGEAVQQVKDLLVHGKMMTEFCSSRLPVLQPVLQV